VSAVARRLCDERGSSTPFAVVVLGLLLFVGAGLGVVAAMVATHRAAQAAADLAALGGASSLQRSADACLAAADVATANGARLAGCQVSGEEVRVVVRVVGPRWLGQVADLAAEARAGPVGAR